MFATLLGPLPRPPLPAIATPEELLVEVLGAQEAAGLEPLIDGGFGIGQSPAERWQTTAALTNRPVKQVLLGPYSAARTQGVTTADKLRSDVMDLVAAGCPYVEIHEPASTGIGDDADERHRFLEAHLRLLDGVTGAHLSLAITGGNADATGVAPLLAAPYASLAVDLIAGPDNWRIAAAAPQPCGIVCGALSTALDSDDRPEILLWAAGYASSTRGRGRDRVGLATASSLAHLPWTVAMRKLRILGEAARLADLDPDERRQELDPRSVDIRSGATGKVQPNLRPGRRKESRQDPRGGRK